jgi:hypothetical protein
MVTIHDIKLDSASTCSHIRQRQEVLDDIHNDVDIPPGRVLSTTDIWEECRSLYIHICSHALYHPKLLSLENAQYRWLGSSQHTDTTLAMVNP